MSDTHRITETRYVVVESVIDCDDSCLEPGERPEGKVQWDGLPPAFEDVFRRLAENRDQSEPSK